MIFALACNADSRRSTAKGDTQSSAATVTFTNDGPFDFGARMFVAEEDSSGSFFCFAAKDTALTPGMPVTVIFVEFPQRSLAGRLAARRKLPCFPPSRMPPTDSMLYVVQVPRDTLDRIGLPIVVLGPAPSPEQIGDTVTLRVQPGQPAIRFLQCASTEGLHASAWGGTPLASPRKWHAYYYLGYDTDPTCNVAEYAPDSSERPGGG